MAGGGDVAGAVAEGVGVAGERDVGEGVIWAIEVGCGRTPVASSWLNRKLPSSIPTLMIVIARFHSS